MIAVAHELLRLHELGDEAFLISFTTHGVLDLHQVAPSQPRSPSLARKGGGEATTPALQGGLREMWRAAQRGLPSGCCPPRRLAMPQLLPTLSEGRMTT